jgi:hypothetical protein
MQRQLPCLQMSRGAFTSAARVLCAVVLLAAIRNTSGGRYAHSVMKLSWYCAHARSDVLSAPMSRTIRRF